MNGDENENGGEQVEAPTETTTETTTTTTTEAPAEGGESDSSDE